jgi:hypothetical protein
MGTKVEFENDRVKVLRVTHGSRETHPVVSRNDRLVIYLNDGHVIRSESGNTVHHRRKAGEVVWRARSQHQVENAKESEHDVIIVEFKDVVASP